MFWYEPNWYYSCFSQVIKSFGIGFISSFFGGGIQGNILTLRSLSNVVPQVSPLGADESLNSKDLYPELVKLGTSPEIYISARLFTLVSLGYRGLIVIASNETAGLKSYEFFKGLIEKSGLRIVNDEGSRFIPYYYKRENFTEHEDVFKRIYKTRCTVMLILVFNHDMVLEALNDVGYRSGEVVIAHDTSVINYLLSLNININFILIYSLNLKMMILQKTLYVPMDANQLLTLELI